MNGEEALQGKVHRFMAIIFNFAIAVKLKKFSDPDFPRWEIVKRNSLFQPSNFNHKKKKKQDFVEKQGSSLSPGDMCLIRAWTCELCMEFHRIEFGSVGHF